MGLRLSESLALQVGDIDGKHKLVHIRRGKGHKDRFVPFGLLKIINIVAHARSIASQKSRMRDFFKSSLDQLA